ncbi:2Fe-2S iron-sulfur cluster binding domain-containing protein [Cryobacterium sp. TMT1-3]|uniref:2Fe-2S iron-sulfur cluster binding domain-containing protein n=1 Tax=Cryobacterium luteum TaxID=1424661 RepID=A0A1H8B3K4_9MICO|nr:MULTISPECIES: 2Fe-2S iron-sulfur cluster-binding protein [Cryobacterium]TFB88728.1 2Fe-2S iron-sulfur cluster binding domain-containing protein [Cryobacterium luteum]TFC24732.1 2Fe-2S iron-sulfur cluster binding domain-containing protein [Cryobacterium sp. TMT1-3]SEM77502.1 ferredoxin, 2Fe-2S [Cryobacterium luteum]
MPYVTYISATGSETAVAGFAGDSVMETAVRNGVPGIVAECGGSLSCATCHVFVCADSVFDPMQELEDDMLDGTAIDREANSRLSCQLKLSDADIRVTTPETQV